MNEKEFNKKLKLLVKQDEANQKDLRFLNTLTFLVQNGLLFINNPKPTLRVRKVRIEDAIWAGLNVEPRILEVLPAAILRFPKYFEGDLTENKNLREVLVDLKNNEEVGHDFYFIPYDKVRKWAHHQLKDGRIKPLNKKKTAKNYRFAPETLAKLKKIAIDTDRNETDIIEELIRKA